jgi:beta-N-acetylhexosaminidase
LTGGTDEESIKEEIDITKMGGIRFNPKPKYEMWEMNRRFQKHSRIPVLSAVNVESGGNGASKDGTNVGQEIKVAATGDSKYAYKLGQICGREAKATGSNWAFAPITDITYNWHTPVISTRAFGNDPDMVLEMSKEYFRGISESGIVCAMKHFPGDGLDERDQHVATSVNSFSCEEWDETFGKVYEGMIDAGVQSVMTGHIMMPAYQKHFNPDMKENEALPATICKELLTDLLRGKLGFNGLIVTDASHMVGLAGRAKRSNIVPDSIMAGCDMFLFFNDIQEDTRYMTEAYKDGRLTEERLMDALRRILGLKALVGLDTFTMDKFPPKEGLDIVGCEEHKEVSKEVSDKSITLVKQVGEDIFPVVPEKYKNILIVPVGPEPSPILVMSGQGADGSKLVGSMKSKLEDRGHNVTIYEDPVKKLFGELEKLTPEQRAEMMKVKRNPKNAKGIYGMKTSIASMTDNYDLVICVANVSATMRTTQRLEWAISKGGWDNPWYVNELPVIFVSFNCPFHLADVPQVKNFVNCYDSQESSVDSFVEKIAGESEFKGVSTVDAFCGMMDTKF